MFESLLGSISNDKLHRIVEFSLRYLFWLLIWYFVLFVENLLWWLLVVLVWGVLAYAAYRRSKSWPRPVVYLGGACAVWLLCYVVTIFDVAGLNTYSEGWRAGTLADFSVSNRLFQWLPAGSFFPTGEGYLLLGDASSRGASMNGKIISPSDFSTSYPLFVKDNTLTRQPVAMRFRVLRHTWFLNGATDVRVQQFDELKPVKLPPDCAERMSALGSRAYGVIGGKVVEAARVMVGVPLIRTNEVIIHTGGNEFQEMSVTDDRIFQCAVMALQTGEQVRINYENRLFRNPLTQNTNFNLVAIAN